MGFSEKAERYHRLHMDFAIRTAKMSFAVRRKVGAIAVRDGNVLGYGFNGTPAGEDNNCEDAEGNTLPSVIHAEDNLIRKIQKSQKSQYATNCLYGVTVYVTKEPCINCARKLMEQGVKAVFYKERSKTKHGEGIYFLEEHGIMTYQM